MAASQDVPWVVILGINSNVIAVNEINYNEDLIYILEIKYNFKEKILSK